MGDVLSFDAAVTSDDCSLQLPSHPLAPAYARRFAQLVAAHTGLEPSLEIDLVLAVSEATTVHLDAELPVDVALQVAAETVVLVVSGGGLPDGARLDVLSAISGSSDIVTRESSGSVVRLVFDRS